MAITIRKKTLTLAGQPGEGQVSQGAPGAASAAGPVAVAPAPAKASGAFYTASMIFALLSALMFIALLAVQYFEHDFLRDAFPVRTAFVTYTPETSVGAPTPAPVTTPVQSPTPSPAR